MAINKEFRVKHGLISEGDVQVNGSVTATSFIGDGSQLTGISSFSGDYNDLTNKPVLFSGNYNDLTNLPTIPTVPTNVSAFVNDAGYITSASLTWTNLSGKPSFATVATSGLYNDLTNKPTIPSLTGYATESYVNTQVANLVDSSPTTLDTLNELAAALGDDPNFATTVSNQIGLKANTADLSNVAFNGVINSLDDVTISSPTATHYLKFDGTNWINSPVSSIADITNGGISTPTFVQFDTVNTPLTNPTGQISWNALEGTLDIGLNNGVVLQTGQETQFYAKAVGAIANGNLVMFAGSQGDHLLITKANLNAVGFEDTWIVGIATQSFAANDFGYVTTFGKVRQLNTSAYAEGTILYADKNVLGGLTAIKPTAPDHIIEVAAVVRSHQNEGTLLVRPTFGKHLEDLHDVLIASQTNNDVLKYDDATGVWKNAQFSYNDLVDKPTIATDVSQLTDNAGVLFSGNYNDLTNKPSGPVFSPQFSFPSTNSALNWAHGLGSAPRLFGMFAVCTSSINGVPVGTRLAMSSNDGDGGRQTSVYANSTNVGFFGSQPIYRGFDGNNFTLNSSNFNCYFWAEL